MDISADFRTDFTETLPMKFARPYAPSGLKEIDFQHKFVAIKIHFGEAGNLAHLRPPMPGLGRRNKKRRQTLLTDCNTLYVGARKNAIDHLTCAKPTVSTCKLLLSQNIIADGLRGT